MKVVTIRILIVVIFIAWAVAIFLGDSLTTPQTAVKIEMKEPEVNSEAYYKADIYNIKLKNPEVECKDVYWLTYPQYYSFDGTLIRVDAPVDGVHKVTVEREK